MRDESHTPEPAALATPGSSRRPRRLTAIALFFAFGAAMSALTFTALLLPGGWLDPIWGLNPRARDAFQGMGHSALLLMAAVSLLCGLAAVGIWRGRRYGLVLGVATLVVSMLGDLANALLGEPRAWLGVPIAAVLLAALLAPAARSYCTGRG